jgi:two-component system response regulator YesN
MRSVLVIDDDLGMCEMFADALHSAGYDVVTANTGQKGLNLARSRPFDVILADLRLPDMSGVDVLRMLRAEREDVPLVIMTAFASVVSSVAALKLGALDYIEKPLGDTDLVEVVNSAANASAARRTPHMTATLCSNAIGDAGNSRDARVTWALGTIERRYEEFDLSSADVAREVGVSIGHFCVLLKRETGHTFGTHLHRCRVAKAKKRLRETTRSIKEIAFSVGYRTTKQLDRHFLRHGRTTPIAYRRRFWHERNDEDALLRT